MEEERRVCEGVNIVGEFPKVTKDIQLLTIYI